MSKNTVETNAAIEAAEKALVEAKKTGDQTAINAAVEEVARLKREAKENR